ncbi:hypothetical protein UFOVP241_49 [uncultured Caudovirales phage]|uniref:Uncharacterized protein n=1 Tax=uncultured Caudovirales phage TaxID=2100421 RepID=A0A6J7X0Y5_9CAUD|nr:hypothetical protein UFOVP241_49 [uncultured Caudovirales phage]
MNPIRLEDDYSYTVHQTGSVSTLPAEPENETVEQLHQVVFEVTGKRVEPPAKPRMGFLP